jgi:RNA recognition motif-containing protein
MHGALGDLDPSNTTLFIGGLSAAVNTRSVQSCAPCSHQAACGPHVDLTTLPAMTDSSLTCTSQLAEKCTSPIIQHLKAPPSCARQVTEDQLRAIFQRFGEIVYVKIPAGKGCGFVQFMGRPNAEAAMLAMNGQVHLIVEQLPACCAAVVWAVLMGGCSSTLEGAQPT